MKAKQLASILSLTFILAGAALAQDGLSDRVAFEPGTALFSPNELSLDLFGYHGSRDKGNSPKDAWGPGVGLNYFITQDFGVGADTYADAFVHPYLVNGSAIFRYPLGDSGLAPYVYAGAGRQWSFAAQWTGHIAGGLEYRFNARTGVFADVRRVFAASTEDYTVVRFGFRLAF
ncbi:MAG: hypothetical protein JWR26_233 [Pedosphaera sp.]|nr:hypothetical protein [Pedosphaera sp.]